MINICAENIFGFVVWLALPISGVLLAAAQVSDQTSLASITLGSDERIHIIDSAGKEFVPPKEKDQVDCASPKIAEDRHTAGWLVEYDNYGTSYPIPLTLVIYRDGKTLRRLGDGMLIADWFFLEGGKKVAFYTNTVHGDLAPHYELHEVASGELLSKWDGKADASSPTWMKIFQRPSIDSK